MDSKKGMVMDIHNNTAYILTNEGEFTKVKINKNKPKPSVGEEYIGTAVNNIFLNTGSVKFLVAASIMFLVLLVGGGSYSYYKPVSSIIITINPALEIKSNMWNRIIYVQPLNDDGKRILSEVWLKNKKVDDAISIVLTQAKSDKFINDIYISSGKVVTINITGKQINTVKLESMLTSEHINVNLLNNGVTIFKKDLNKDDKTIINNNYKNELDGSSETPSKGDANKDKKSNNSSNNYKENHETNAAKTVDKHDDNNNINSHKKNDGNEQTDKNNNGVNQKDSHDKFDSSSKYNEDKSNQSKNTNVKEHSETEKKNDKKDK